MVLIRVAKPNDAESIARVHLTSWTAAFVPLLTPELVAGKNLDETQEIARWQKRLTQEPERITLVAEQAKQIVGYISGGPEKYGIAEYDSELYQIYVLPEAQGQSIGTQLVTSLVAALQAAHFTSMIVWVMTLNPAVKFYRDILGGTYIAERPIPEVDGKLQEAGYGWRDLSIFTKKIDP